MDSIHIRGEGGSVIEFDLPLSEPMAAKLHAGLVQRVNPDGTVYTPAAGPAAGGVSSQRPANGASKGDWVAWAIAQGADPAAAAGMTKPQLIDAYGQTAPVVAGRMDGGDARLSRGDGPAIADDGLSGEGTAQDEADAPK